MIFKFFIIFALSAIDFFSILNSQNLFIKQLFSYQKYFSIILLFFSYSLEENKLVQSNKHLPFNITIINPIPKYPHIIRFYACILKRFVGIFQIFINFYFFFWNIFNSKAIKTLLHYQHLHTNTYVCKNQLKDEAVSQILDCFSCFFTNISNISFASLHIS